MIAYLWRRWRCWVGLHTTLKGEGDAWYRCWYCSWSEVNERGPRPFHEELCRFHEELFHHYNATQWPYGGYFCSCLHRLRHK